MSPNSRMGEELKLQQRWEFRRKDNDFDSSSNDSKSSGKPALKKHKLLSSFLSVDDDETSDTSKLQQNGNHDPPISEKMKSRQTEKVQRRRTKKDNLAHNETKKAPRKEVRRKKSKTSTDEQEAFDDLKRYMNFLLEDLKVSRENLLKWMREEMQNLVAEETVSELETREGSSRGEKVQLQRQDQNSFGKDTPARHQNKFQEYGQVQSHNKFEENAHLQHLINSEKNAEVRHQKFFQEKFPLQHQNAFRLCAEAHNCSSGPTAMFCKTNKSTDFNNCSLAFEDQANYSQAIVPVTTAEKDREERMALSAKLNSKSILSDQNVQMQHPKSIVLGIRAQNCNGGSLDRSAKSRKTVDSYNHYQMPEGQLDYVQAIGSMASVVKDKAERSELSVEPIFSTESSNQAASSMYLTLPTVLTKPYVASHRFDPSSFNSIQPRVAGNQTGMNSERPNLILGSSSHHGYFQGMQQPEERSRNFSQMSSKDVDYFNQNSTMSSLMGNGFTFPFHQAASGGSQTRVGLENFPRDNSSTSGLNIMNAAAMRFPGGNYSFPEQYIVNNFLSHPNYRPDGRPLAYQDGYQFTK